LVLIKKAFYKFLIVYNVVTVIILGVLFYNIILNKELLSSLFERKYYAEILIFIVILFITVNLIMAFYFYRKSINVLSVLNKTIEFSRQNNFNNNLSGLQKIGEFGDKINKLFQNLNEISNKRKLKISSLYHLLDHIVTLHKEPIIVINTAGEILFVSNKMLEKLNIDKILLQTMYINEVIDINLNKIIMDVNLSKDELKKEDINLVLMTNTKKVQFVLFQPFFNMDNVLSNMILVFKFSL